MIQNNDLEELLSEPDMLFYF